MKTQKDCVFCSIIAGIIPANVITKNEHVLVIEDIAPKAPIHYLVMPTIHITDMSAISAQDEAYLLAMMFTVKDLSTKLPKQPAAFNIIANNGKAAGQSVFHLHWHFLADKDLYHGDFVL